MENKNKLSVRSILLLSFFSVFIFSIFVSNVSADLTQNLVSYWKFNDTSAGIAQDAAHIGINNLTLVDITPNIAGLIDYGINLSNDTKSNAYSIGNLTGFGASSTTVTISIWLNMTNASSQVGDANFSARWLELWSGGSGNTDNTLYIATNTTNLIFGAYNGSVTIEQTKANISLNVWHNVILSFRGGNSIEGYLDGLSLGTTTSFGGSMFFSSNNVIRLTVGNDRTQSRAGQGKIDEVAIWNADKRAEAMRIYNNGSGNQYPFHYLQAVNLSSPVNGSTISQVIGKTINASGNMTWNGTLINSTAYWYSSSGSFIGTNFTTSVDGNKSGFAIPSLSNGTYLWNVQMCDSESFCTFAPSNFTINLNSTAPNIAIFYPKNASSYSVNITSFNFSTSDPNLGQCWYSTDYGITNHSTSCIQNVSLNSSQGYNNWTISSNNTWGNVATSFVQFYVDTTSIIINNLFPLNNEYLNTNNFNLTCSASGVNLGSMFLYGNFSGTYNLNSTNSTTVSGADWNQSMNLPDGNYIYSCAANRTAVSTLVFDSFGNNTFTVDTIPPQVNKINPLPVANSQTFTFTVNVTDINLNTTCRYSIINNTGGIDGTNQNVSFVCNSTPSATTTAFGTYNLTVLATDLAGNSAFNTTSVTTTSGGGGGGGGGGGSSTNLIPVIGLNDINASRTYTPLDREIIYAVINTQCSINLGGGNNPVKDYSDTCRLTETDLQPLIDTLKSDGTQVTIKDLDSFNMQYISKAFFQGFESQSTIDKYHLFTSVLGLTTLLQILPSPNVNQPFFINVPDKSAHNITFVLTSNKPIATCDVVTGKPNFICQAKNSTILLTYMLNNTDFFNLKVQGSANILTVAPSDKVERQTITFAADIYNGGYNVTSGLPVYYVVIGVGLIVIFSLLYYFRTKSSKRKKLNIADFLSPR